MEFIQSIDFALLNAIKDNLTCAFLDFIMPLITVIGNDGIAYIILAVILMIFKKTRKYGIMLGIALLFGLIFGNILLKNLIARPRPFTYNDMKLIIPTPDEYSFPSGHSMASFETASVVFYMNRKAGAVMLVIASLVAFSRLYLYVHFPTDVICGCILGTIFGICAIKLYNFIAASFTKKA